MKRALLPKYVTKIYALFIALIELPDVSCFNKWTFIQSRLYSALLTSVKGQRPYEKPSKDGSEICFHCIPLFHSASMYQFFQNNEDKNGEV